MTSVVTCLTYDIDSKLILSVSVDNKVIAWSPFNVEIVWDHTLTSSIAVCSILSVKKRIFLTISKKGDIESDQYLVHLLDTVNGKTVPISSSHATKPFINVITFSNIGQDIDVSDRQDDYIDPTNNNRDDSYLVLGGKSK